MELFQDWGPYLSFGRDASSEMRISWETKHYETSRKLAYGKTQACDQIIEEKQVEPTRHHCVILQDLDANTTYYYKIYRGTYKNNQQEDNLVSSQVFSFKTGPKLDSNQKSSFEFTIVGDIHANGIARRQIGQGFDIMDKKAPERAFTLVVGDSIDDGFREADWCYFFESLNPYLHSLPMMNSTGNHDTGDPLKFNRFIQTWNHPFHNKFDGGYYSFLYGNAYFIIIDSDSGGKIGDLLSDDQFEWLEEELEYAHKKNYWIFVAFHRQMYSTGDFSMNGMMHTYFRPLFDEYHVDAVFYGHDHNYQAFWTDRDSEWGGTKYFVCGGGGGQEKMEVKIMGKNEGKTMYVWPSRTYIYSRDGIIPDGNDKTGNTRSARMDEILPNQLFAILEPNFVSLRIDGDNAKLVCYGWEEQIFHELSFEKTKKQ